ncbi:hypothetical protein BU26DRAFT_300099 [Trematosphaeria pertusa]|uniref:Secreted protein n=1 Tax=Trematosphaeria pertusa TaxID=390896 RepID=A0A6A6IIZ4_9PLEO|nr:uncharacterized protein BU26DRAFT_300099 [Trematosphaeria pertusa]KAF2250346.1 hypothetical protein BU26DRAFT_300099 [Trematosphaeria pertusa]
MSNPVIKSWMPACIGLALSLLQSRSPHHSAANQRHNARMCTSLSRWRCSCCRCRRQQPTVSCRSPPWDSHTRRDSSCTLASSLPFPLLPSGASARARGRSPDPHSALRKEGTRSQNGVSLRRMTHTRYLISPRLNAISL